MAPHIQHTAPRAALDARPAPLLSAGPAVAAERSGATRTRRRDARRRRRGSVYVETLIAFLPVFVFFFGTLQIADSSVAHLLVEHAATAAARAAVVVLPDDGAFYDEQGGAQRDRFEGARRDDVERAADIVMEANPRLGRDAQNVALDRASYRNREQVTARVDAHYTCLVPIFCPSGIEMRGQADLIYQGANYIYQARDAAGGNERASQARTQNTGARAPGALRKSL